MTETTETGPAAALPDGEVELLARALYEAERTAQPIDPLTDRHPDLGVDDAYAIQNRFVSLRLDDGATLVGNKIGLTSKAMQRYAGVDQPDYGQILDVMIAYEDEPVDTTELIAPRVEAELAFVLDQSLEGPGVTLAAVLLATAHVLPVLEIVDSRIRNWQIKLADTVADNASSGRVVLGGLPGTAGGRDLRLTGMVMRKQGEIVQTAAGAAVMGHPGEAVAWLANTLARFGRRLEAGHIVLAGAFSSLVEVGAGETVSAEFDGLGSVTARFA